MLNECSKVEIVLSNAENKKGLREKEKKNLLSWSVTRGWRPCIIRSII